MNSLKPEMLFAWATSVAAKSSEATVMSDPYYGDEKNFEHVLDLVEEASEGLMTLVIKKVHGHD